MVAATGSGPTDVAPLDETVGANLLRAAAAHGDNDALVARHQGIRWTYADFGDRVERLARGLLGLGVAAGDRVGLWSPNHAEWTLLRYATAHVGAILVNINPASRTNELADVLGGSGCRLLFAAPSFKSSDYVDMVETVAGDIATLERAVFFWEDDWDEIVAGTNGPGLDALHAREATLRPDDPINIQFTSGTTGFPKGATLTHRDILNDGCFVAERQRFTPADRLCTSVAFDHCVGRCQLGNLDEHGTPPLLPTVCAALHWGQESWIEIRSGTEIPELITADHVHGQQPAGQQPAGR